MRDCSAGSPAIWSPRLPAIAELKKTVIIEKALQTDWGDLLRRGNRFYGVFPAKWKLGSGEIKLKIKLNE